MRTQDEIVAFYDGYVDQDVLGFTFEALVEFLDADHVRRLTKPGADLSDWTWTEPTSENVLNTMRKYMAFAWEKVEGHRGISARRSIEKMSAWLWLLGNEELRRFAEAEENFPRYGAPVLAKISEKYGFPIPDNPRIQRMRTGEACHEDCDEGCYK